MLIDLADRVVELRDGRIVDGAGTIGRTEPSHGDPSGGSPLG